MLCRFWKKIALWFLMFLSLICINFTNNTTFAATLGTTNQISDYGVTWNFSSSVQYGQYISWDYWVVWPVEIISVSPDWELGHHWIEVNPENPQGQPYDDRALFYNSWSLLTLPYMAQSWDSIVKTISMDSSLPTCRPCVLEASILSVVSQIPHDDAFRPSYASSNKKQYRWSDIDFSLLPQVDTGDLTLPRYSGTDTPDYSQDGWSIVDLSSTETYFERPWIDHLSDYYGRTIHPENHMPDYGGDMYKLIGTAILRTMLHDTNAQKRDTLIGLLQYGIDIEGFMLNIGTEFRWNGGHTWGRKMALTFAGVLFDDDEIKNFVHNSRPVDFSEDDHNYFSLVANGGLGTTLLGDETWPSWDSRYWDLLETWNGFRTHKDPYGYIDGGYNAGDHYLIPINAPFWKSDVVAMLLMPELKPVYNNNDLEQVTYRYVNHWKWTQPDPCAPFDGNPANRGITYGPDGSGGCIADTDPSDGIWRYPNLHGSKWDGGAYSRYRVPLADALWNKYITNSQEIIDHSGVIQAEDEWIFWGIWTIPVISYGQSVSVWAGGILSPDAHGPENPLWSQHILTMNTAKDDFVSLASINDRSHDQWMLERTVANYLEEYSDSPDFISLRAWVWWRSIQELSIRPEHIFSTWSLSDLTDIVPTQYSFALQNGENYDIYMDNDTSSPVLLTTNKPRPTHYENLIQDFSSLKSLADAQWVNLNTTIIFNWTQWQSNTWVLPYGYNTHLGRIIDMLQSDISTIYGEPVKVISMINQVASYSLNTPTAQMKLIRDREDVHFWTTEYTYNITLPQRNTDSLGAHLNSLWYRLMGENMWYQLYDILTKWYSNSPYIRSYSYNSGTSELVLNFGGLKWSLVSDNSLTHQTYTSGQRVNTFVEDVQSYFPYSLSHGWFYARSSQVSASWYTILDADSISVQFTNPWNNDFNFEFWENLNGVFLTGMRDSLDYGLLVPASNYGDTSVHRIKFFPYLDKFPIYPWFSGEVDLWMNQNSTPYSWFTVDMSQWDQWDSDTESPDVVQPINKPSGGSGKRRDVCPDGDDSWSRYDGKCEWKKISEDTKNWPIVEVKTHQERQQEIITQTGSQLINDDRALKELEEILTTDEKLLIEKEEKKQEYIKNFILNKREQAQITASKSSFPRTRKEVKKSEVKNKRNTSQVTYIQKIDYKKSCENISKLQEDTQEIRESINASYKFLDEGESIKRYEIRKLESLWIIQWYEDGSFRPEIWVSRWEFLKILLKSHCYSYADIDTNDLDFIDVDSHSWQARVIAKAQELDLVKWSTNTRGEKVFRPNDTITKVEALKIILRLSEIETQDLLESEYSDIKVQWHEKYVRTWESLGLYDAYMDGQEFNPDEVMKREDMVDLIERFVQLYE